jgi:hypothetical protein
VTTWNGANRREMPADIRKVFESADSRSSQSNITLFVLDPDGRVVDAFPPFPGKNPASVGFDPKRLAGYLKEQLDQAIERLGLDLDRITPPPARVHLPDVAADDAATTPAGVRVLLTFTAQHLRSSYSAPVVEAVAIQAAERKALRYPAEETTVPAAALSRWLEQIYPPAIMTRSGQVEEISGTLTLAPAGADRRHRYAVLKGPVRFRVDDDQRTTYTGKLEVVLTYPQEVDDFQTLRGAFEGVFPKGDRHRGRTIPIHMTAAIESIPD